MRVRIVHDIHFTYAEPAAGLIALVRLTPRNHAGQFVHDWRIDLSTDAAIQRFFDPFGNAVHTFTLDGPIDELTVTATGTVETGETDGVVGDLGERMQPAVFLRETRLTAHDGPVAAFAAEVAADAAPGDSLDLCHRLNVAIGARVGAAAEPADELVAPAAALEAGEGSRADRAHLFVAACRARDVPARVVTGYRGVAEGEEAREASDHVWGEALIPRLGWVGFDPGLGLSVTEAYVRVASGPDFLAAAPVRSFHRGGAGERIATAIRLRSGLGGQRLRPPAPGSGRAPAPAEPPAPPPPAGGRQQQSQ